MKHISSGLICHVTANLPKGESTLEMDISRHIDGTSVYNFSHTLQLDNRPKNNPPSKTTNGNKRETKTSTIMRSAASKGAFHTVDIIGETGGTY